MHVPKFSSSFDGRASTSQEIPLTAPFPTESWASAAISVRLHEKANFITGASAVVVVQNAVQVPDEPSVIYAADLTTVTIVSGDAAPKLYTAAIAAPIGPMLRLLLRWTQPATPAQTSASTFAISIDLVGRTA